MLFSISFANQCTISRWLQFYLILIQFPDLFELQFSIEHCFQKLYICIQFIFTFVSQNCTPASNSILFIFTLIFKHFQIGSRRANAYCIRISNHGEPSSIILAKIFHILFWNDLIVRQHCPNKVRKIIPFQ